MTEDQEVHLQKIKSWFVNNVDKKYRAGQKEHGGNLWLKADIIDMALDEVLDIAVYLVTLKAQLAKTNLDELYVLKDGQNLPH
jgi:hypothetical protein